MKKTLLIIGLIGIMGIMSACEAADPIDDIYTSNILVGNSGGNVGEIDRPYDAGYFDNIETGSIETTDIETDSLTLDGVDMSAHASTHEWGGSDEVDIKDMATLALGQRYAYAGHIWNFVLTTTGGRGGGGVPYTGLQLVTGWVANDVAGIMCGSGQWFNAATTKYHYRLCGDYVFSENTTTENWIGWFDDTATFPTITDNHTGFRHINGRLYASNGNGIAGTQVEIGNSYPNWATIPLGMHYDTGGISYYEDNNPTPETIITTNIPNDVTLYHGIWSKTTDGTVHQSWLLGYQILVGE